MNINQLRYHVDYQNVVIFESGYLSPFIQVTTLLFWAIPAKRKNKEK